MALLRSKIDAARRAVFFAGALGLARMGTAVFGLAGAGVFVGSFALPDGTRFLSSWAAKPICSSRVVIGFVC